MINCVKLAIPGRAFVVMLPGEMFTSRPRVKGKPVAVVVSNFNPISCKSICTCRSVPLRDPAAKVMVKKFGSIDDELVMSPNAVMRTDSPDLAERCLFVRQRDVPVAWLKNGS